MKKVKNTSLQGFDVYFQTEKGLKSFYFPPNHSKIVPDTYLTEQVKLLQIRRLFKITNI